MKNLLIIVTALLLFGSCKKEDPITKNDDPCENITCLHGTCVNGLCDCETGYEGASCSQEKTPAKVIVSEVTITSFPPTDNGGGWDVSSSADVYLVLLSGTNPLWTATTYYEDATYNSSYTWSISPSVDLIPANQYSIVVYDYDSPSADDYMGGISFYPIGSKISGFPSVMSVEYGDFKFTFKVSYIFN